jgi:AcrR family transcriptional regulator
MPRPKKTDAEIQVMRTKILDAAYAILQESGPQAITSRAIAERLGVAHMGLFKYFQNQAAILSALREQELAKMRLQQRAFEQRAETEDIVQIVEEALEIPIRYAREAPNLYYLAWVIPEIGGESLEQNRQRRQGTIEQLAHLIKKGMDQGKFVSRDPILAAATVLGMVNMPYILFYSGKLANPELRDRMVEEVLDAAMGYLSQQNNQ